MTDERLADYEKFANIGMKFNGDVIIEFIAALRAERASGDKWYKFNKQLCDENESLRKELVVERAKVAELQNNITNWISVNDNIPIKDSLVDVLINGTCRMINVIYTDRQKKYLWTDEHEELTWRDIESTGEKITHWMYIPKNPTDGK